MNTSDRQLYECLIRIRNLPELAPFKNFLEEQIVLETTMMASLNDDRGMWRAQGAVRALSKLKNLIEDSKAVLEKPRPTNVVGGHFVTSHSP